MEITDSTRSIVCIPKVKVQNMSTKSSIQGDYQPEFLEYCSKYQKTHQQQKISLILEGLILIDKLIPLKLKRYVLLRFSIFLAILEKPRVGWDFPV